MSKILKNPELNEKPKTQRVNKNILLTHRESSTIQIK